MSGFVEGEDRRQPALLPSCLDDYVGEENPARVIDVFVDELDLVALGFEMTPAATGRPAYHPAMLLKLYIYGYLNRVQSSRRLEREAQRNVELMWLAATPGGQISLTDPDARAMATSGRLTGIVGYNVQTAVEAEHHLIVAHDVVMTGSEPSAARCNEPKGQGGHGDGDAGCAGRPRLLLRRRDPGLRNDRRHAHRAPTPHLGRAG